MIYKSTRGNERASAAEAIVRGLSLDGGLFTPPIFPALSKTAWQKVQNYEYKDIAVSILYSYLCEDYSLDEIKKIVSEAYREEKFPEGPVVLNNIDKNLSVLELWHGPTFAFKDMALQILPHLLLKAIEKTGEKKDVVILVATSGDTGKAALDGFADIEGTKIIVFYPDEGVSEIQKLQMITQKGNNVGVFAIKGNFDDAQSAVKQIFNDKEMKERLLHNGYTFSSANSINLGRLLPQIIYYFYSYIETVKRGRIKLGDHINFVVPTGNFGNILAGYYAKRMGLPVAKLICASNRNKVLADFIKTGVYNRERDFYKTTSPSMDILISSNLERLLYHLTSNNSDKIKEWMQDLDQQGSYDIGSEYKRLLKDNFYGGWADDEKTKNLIEKVFNKYGYLIDTHTSVAWCVYEDYINETNDSNHTVILSTASPFKFGEDVLNAIDSNNNEKNPFLVLDKLAKVANLTVPYALENLQKEKVLHNKTIEKEGMQKEIENVLGV